MSKDANHDAEDYVLITGSDTDEAKRLGESQETIAQIKSWLAPTEFDSDTSEYKKHLNAHVPGTSEWIMDTEQYKKWYETNQIGDLWIRGIPGSGKSVVAGNLIRKLKAKGDAPVLYFFFRHIILSNRSPQSLLRDCSFQLLDHSPLLQSRLNGAMEKYSSIEQIPFDDLFKCFSSALTAMKKVYCVLDALDEMDLGQDTFLADLLNLGRRYPKSIKLALTSRQLPYLEAHFRGSCLVDLRLDRINVDNDIAIYISHRLKNLQAIIMPEEAQAIKTAICDKGKGLFLYARLMMDECIRDPKRFLSQKLPNGLGNMYSDLLTEHSIRSGATQSFQKLVLGWITHSQRPLRLIELTAVINSMADRGGLADLQDTKIMIRSCCGPLIEICEDELIQIIHHSFTEFLCGSELSHVQMEEHTLDRFPVLDSMAINSDISIACLRYLQSGCFEVWTIEPRRSLLDAPLYSNHSFFSKDRFGSYGECAYQERTITFNFLPYAAQYWPVHAAKVDGENPALHQALDSFFSEENKSYQAWKDVWSGITSYTPTEINSLHVSGIIGLTDYAEKLILRGLDVNSVDGLGRTPLIYAAMNGHDSTVAVLLEHFASHDIVDGRGLNAFLYAAKMGYAQILRSLLLTGADPLAKKTNEEPGYEGQGYGSAKSSIGETALFYICTAGHLEALLVLLQHLDLDTLGCIPLHWAIQHTQAEIVTALLQHKSIASHIDDRDAQGNTALYLAARAKDPKTVRALLNANANVDLRSYAKTRFLSIDQTNGIYNRSGGRIEPKSSYTPLHGWARLEFDYPASRDGTDLDLIEVLDLLVDAGCDINAQDHLGQTVLFGWNTFSYGNEKQQVVFISSLLRRGADATVLDFSGSSVFFKMKAYRNEFEALQLLQKAGANINHVRKSDGRTSLINTSQVHQLKDPSIFQQMGAKPDIQDHSGNTALHYACLSLSMTNKCTLNWLSFANPTIQNNVGRLALSHCQWEWGTEGYKDIVAKMIELGLDLETRDHLGRTPLLHLFCDGRRANVVIINELLAFGASAKAKDDEGKSALHLLVRSELSHNRSGDSIQLKYEAMESLIKAGCKLNARDHKGNGIFHDAISWQKGWSYSYSSVIAITKIGADLNSPNHEGRTALHSAAAIEDSGGGIKADGSAGSHLDFILRPDLMFNVNMVDLKGISPLHIAAKVSEINVWKLVQAGAQIHATDIYGRTALHCAAAAGKCNIVDLLVSMYLEQSISVDPTDLMGRTPLHEAAKSGDRDSVVTLLIAGADANIQDKRKRSPLHAAAEFEYVPVARLQQQKFDSQDKFILDSRSSFDSSWGLKEGNAFDRMNVVRKLGDEDPQIREVVNLLLKANANPGCLDFNDHTPSDIAVMLGNAPVVQVLAPSMAMLYSSEDSELKPPDPFGESLLSTQKSDLMKLLESLDRNSNHFAILERAISFGNDAIIVEAVTSKRIQLISVDGSSPLHLVARLGRTALMEKLLPRISDINAFSPPLLHAAIQRESTNTEMLHILINAGANVEVIYKDAQYTGAEPSSIIHALATGAVWWYPKALSLILDTGANIEILDGYDKTPLQTALSCRGGSSISTGFSGTVGYWGEHSLDVLLSGGANLNTISPTNLTPLNTALASARGQDVLKKLLDHGADGGFGPVPALSSAIDSKDIVSLRMLLQAGANPNVVYTATKKKRYEKEARLETPLFNAATMEEGYVKASKEAQWNMIELLLKYGADMLQSLGDNQSTVLHEIAELNGLLSTNMLNGVDLEIRDSNRMTPLLRACHTYSGYRKIDPGAPHTAIVLISNGADIHAVDANGWTVLHHAVSTGLTEVCELLIKNGASVTAKNNDGKTPFICAFFDSSLNESTKRKEIELLLDAGANPLEEFPRGRTPLHCLSPYLLERSSKDGLDKHGEYGAETNPSELLHLKALYARFISLGWSPDAVDDEGRTPIFDYVVAMKYYNEVSASIPPDEKDHAEMFALHDIFKVNNEGEGLLHLVAKREEDGDCDGLDGVTLFKMLLALGLDPRAENKMGVTPLDIAAAIGNELVLDLFARKDGA